MGQQRGFAIAGRRRDDGQAVLGDALLEGLQQAWTRHEARGRFGEAQLGRQQ
jgi:hypothetical protein